MSVPCMADSLYEAVNEGNVDIVMDLLKRGVNVNILSSSGRTHLGRASQLGHIKIVCLLLDADKFFSTPEEEQLSPTDVCSSNYDTQNLVEDFSCLKTHLKAPRNQVHKCCSPSIDSETFTCSDEFWSHDASDTNTGQQSDLELGSSSRENVSSIRPPLTVKPTDPLKTPSVEMSQSETNGENTPTPSASSFCSSTTGYSSLPPYTNNQFTGSNIGYYVYEYREEEEQEDTEESSGPILSSTEDSDSAIYEHKQLPPQAHRHSSILLHRTLGGRGRSNIVSSDSEFETENYHKRRHIKHNHRSHRHERESGRPKVFISHAQASNPFFAQLHKEYITLGLSSPWVLRRSCDINQHDIYGRCALHYGTEQGHVYIVHMLIKAGAKIDIVDAEHMTPLHLAAQRGFAEVVNLLLEGGAKVNNKMNDKSSPLHIAASRGYTDIVETLLDRGAKIDSLDSSDRTPLMLAVSRAHYKVAQLLIKRGAKVNIEEIHGYTPLCEAVWQKEVKLVQMLLKAKAKITQSHYLLHYAVLHRHYQLAEILLAARCIVNLRDDKGDTPLIIAARSCQPGVIKLLLEHGNENEVEQYRCIVNLRDDKGDTPLIIAARSCQPGVIKLLLEHGANANYPNGLSGAKPLHEAVEGTRDAQFDDFLTVFKLLRSHGVKLDVETLTEGDTPLYRALLLEKNKAAALLIKEGCDVNIQPPDKSSDYLKMAAMRGNFPLASLIVLAGFKMSKATWLTGSHSPETLLAHLCKVKASPLSLADQTRIFIRRSFGGDVVPLVATSGLPRRLRHFLLLKDIKDLDI